MLRKRLLFIAPLWSRCQRRPLLLTRLLAQTHLVGRGRLIILTSIDSQRVKLLVLVLLGLCSDTCQTRLSIPSPLPERTPGESRVYHKEDRNATETARVPSHGIHTYRLLQLLHQGAVCIMSGDTKGFSGSVGNPTCYWSNSGRRQIRQCIQMFDLGGRPQHRSRAEDSLGARRNIDFAHAMLYPPRHHAKCGARHAQLSNASGQPSAYSPCEPNPSNEPCLVIPGVRPGQTSR